MIIRMLYLLSASGTSHVSEVFVRTTVYAIHSLLFGLVGLLRSRETFLPEFLCIPYRVLESERWGVLRYWAVQVASCTTVTKVRWAGDVTAVYVARNDCDTEGEK